MIMKKLSLLSLAVAMLMALAGPVMADDSAAGVSDQDREFVKEAALGSMQEVQLGKIVADRATNSDVKQFGEKMVEEHSKASAKLKEIASQKGLSLPQQLDEDRKEAINDLTKHTGPEFDREYISLMVDDHEEDIDTFKEQAEDGKDPALKQFASQTVPKLEQHLSMAKQIEEKLESPQR